MEKRKNPDKDLRKQSGLFFQIGLLAALMLCVCAFEYRTEKIEPTVTDPNGGVVIDPFVPITTIDPPQPPKPKPVLANPVPAEPDETELEMPDDIVVDLTDIPLDLPEIEEKKEEAPSEPFLIVEKMPEPEGGLEALYKFINKNLKYPAQARRMGIEGTVYVSFVVDENGNMVDINIAKGIGAGCDEEVLRIFENPPKWHPGKQRGVPVKVRQMIPVKFVLN